MAFRTGECYSISRYAIAPTRNASLVESKVMTPIQEREREQYRTLSFNPFLSIPLEKSLLFRIKFKY